MEIRLEDEGTTYIVSSEEQSHLLHWLDRVIMSTEPEDVTGKFFIDDFANPEKEKQLSEGTSVISVVSKRSYPEFSKSTDIIIENGEIIESNSEKGILLGIDNPNIAEGEGYPVYMIDFVKQNHDDARYSGRVHAELIPPHPRAANYYLRLMLNLNQNITSKIGGDIVTYDIDVDSGVIGVQFVEDPTDIQRGMVIPRGLTSSDLENHSLHNHVCFIAEVVGIEPPAFLK